MSTPRIGAPGSADVPVGGNEPLPGGDEIQPQAGADPASSYTLADSYHVVLLALPGAFNRLVPTDPFAERSPVNIVNGLLASPLIDPDRLEDWEIFEGARLMYDPERKSAKGEGVILMILGPPFEETAEPPELPLWLWKACSLYRIVAERFGHKKTEEEGRYPYQFALELTPELVTFFNEIYADYWEELSRLAREAYTVMTTAHVGEVLNWTDQSSRASVFNHSTSRLNSLAGDLADFTGKMNSLIMNDHNNDEAAVELKQLVHDFNGYLTIITGALDQTREAIRKGENYHFHGLDSDPVFDGIFQKLISVYSGKGGSDIVVRRLIDPGLEHRRFLHPSEARSFYRILENLVSNSVKYHRPPEEGLERYVALSARQEGDRVIVGVEDNGQGMTEEFLRNNYGKLHARSAEAVASGVRGSGVGVNSALRRLQSLRGEVVSTTSELGKGTGVHFSIPADLLEQPVVSLDEEAGPQKPDSPVRPAGPQHLKGVNPKFQKLIVHPVAQIKMREMIDLAHQLEREGGRLPTDLAALAKRMGITASLFQELLSAKRSVEEAKTKMAFAISQIDSLLHDFPHLNREVNTLLNDVRRALLEVYRGYWGVFRDSMAAVSSIGVGADPFVRRGEGRASEQPLMVSDMEEAMREVLAWLGAAKTIFPRKLFSEIDLDSFKRILSQALERGSVYESDAHFVIRIINSVLLRCVTDPARRIRLGLLRDAFLVRISNPSQRNHLALQGLAEILGAVDSPELDHRRPKALVKESVLEIRIRDKKIQLNLKMILEDCLIKQVTLAPQGPNRIFFTSRHLHEEILPSLFTACPALTDVTLVVDGKELRHWNREEFDQILPEQKEDSADNSGDNGGGRTGGALVGSVDLDEQAPSSANPPRRRSSTRGRRTQSGRSIYQTGLAGRYAVGRFATRSPWRMTLR